MQLALRCIILDCLSYQYQIVLLLFCGMQSSNVSRLPKGWLEKGHSLSHPGASSPCGQPSGGGGGGGGWSSCEL